MARSLWVQALLGVCCALTVAAPSVLWPASAAGAEPAAVPEGEGQFVAAINQLRAGKGLAPLAIDRRLVAGARRWSATMARAGLHHNPSLAAEGPPEWTILGENVGTGGSVDDIEAAFAASPHHYENLVDPRFQSVGVGVLANGPVLWVTEEFMAGGGEPAPATSAAPPSAAPHGAAPPSTETEPERQSAAPASPPAVVDRVASVLAQLRNLEDRGGTR